MWPVPKCHPFFSPLNMIPRKKNQAKGEKSDLKKKKSKPVWFHVSGSPGQNSPKLWRQKGGELYQKSAAGFWRRSLRWNLRLALLSQEERIFFPSQFVWMELFKKKKHFYTKLWKWELLFPSFFPFTSIGVGKVEQEKNWTPSISK